MCVCGGGGSHRTGGASGGLLRISFLVVVVFTETSRRNLEGVKLTQQISVVVVLSPRKI